LWSAPYLLQSPIAALVPWLTAGARLSSTVPILSQVTSAGQRPHVVSAKHPSNSKQCASALSPLPGHRSLGCSREKPIICTRTELGLDQLDQLRSEVGHALHPEGKCGRLAPHSTEPCPEQGTSVTSVSHFEYLLFAQVLTSLRLELKVLQVGLTWCPKTLSGSHMPHSAVHTAWESLSCTPQQAQPDGPR